MANNYQAYMQSRGAVPGVPPVQFNGANGMNQQQISGNFEGNMNPQFVSSLGFKEVDGLNGVNRYPISPGAVVQLKDINSMTLFIKSADMSGALLPIRVFQLNEVTQDYLDRETPVSRAEFNQLGETISQLSSSMSNIQQLLEDLTAPSSN